MLLVLGLRSRVVSGLSRSTFPLWYLHPQLLLSNMHIHWRLTSHLSIKRHIPWISARHDRDSSCLNVMHPWNVRKLSGMMCKPLFAICQLRFPKRSGSKEIGNDSTEFIKIHFFDHNDIE